MKRVWIATVVVVVGLVLIYTGYSLACNQRLMNRLNPVWEAEGYVLSEGGRPIPDVSLKVSYAIGYYPIGRMLEESPEIDSELLRPETNGFFSIRMRCDTIIISVADGPYQIVGPTNVPPFVIFSEGRESRGNPLVHNKSDKSLKIILKRAETSGKRHGTSSPDRPSAH